jgi:hypothetical protein
MKVFVKCVKEEFSGPWGPEKRVVFLSKGGSIMLSVLTDDVDEKFVVGHEYELILTE